MLSLFFRALVGGCLVWGVSGFADRFTPDKEVKLGIGPVLTVMHASNRFDGGYASKWGVDATVAYAKQKKMKVVYLERRQDPASEYFYQDPTPDYRVHSESFFWFKIPGNHVFSIGGHWTLCHRGGIYSTLNAWKNRQKGVLRITQVMDAIYVYSIKTPNSPGSIDGKLISEKDAYYPKFKDYLKIKSYAQPTEKLHFTGKITLLELMGIVEKRALQFELIERNYELLFELIHPAYSIVLDVMGDRKVVREGEGDDPPEFTFEFISTIGKAKS